MFSMLQKWMTIVLALAPTAMLGCGAFNCGEEGQSQGELAKGGDVRSLYKKLSQLNSPSYYLTVGELERFRPGRATYAILSDIKWRGDFLMSTEDKGHVITDIEYEVIVGNPTECNKGGIVVYALFVDDRFMKFVRQQRLLPEDKELVFTSNGDPWERPKSLKAGDKRFLIRAMSAKAVISSDLKKEVEAASRATPPPEHLDPDLTSMYLALRLLNPAAGPGPLPTERDYLRNAALRDQFNAARLKIGMTRAEVEVVVKAKALESGKIEAGDYVVYGSDEESHVPFWLCYPNILIIFRDAKAITIQRIPGGSDWRVKSKQAISDLPKRAAREAAGSRE